MSDRYYIKTFGCQMNENDSERIAQLLAGQGMEEVANAAEADVVVFNTCTIRENADNKFYGRVNQLRGLKQSRPELRIVVAGCLAQGEREAIFRHAPHVDVVVGTHALSQLPDLLSRSDGRSQLLAVEVAEGAEDPLEDLGAKRDGGATAWVTIQTGCDNSCAFCIVPSVRGPERSRPFQAIVDEVVGLVASGVSEVTLLGQNVNSYGRDLTRRLRASEGEGDWAHLVGFSYLGDAPIARIRPLFPELLRAVGAVPGVRRVRFTSPHPKDMREATFRAMAETGAVCESLHFPLQSGSDRVLAAMHRGYNAERFLERLALARSIVADLAVTTDIIVGFPGETAADFDETLAVTAAAGFDSAYTFIYSPRPGTEAAAMVERYVDPATVQERFERLKAVVERSALQRHRERVGRVEEVLIEGVSKRDREVATGRTRQNKLVHLPGVDGAATAGEYVEVEITGARAHYLLGRFAGGSLSLLPGGSVTAEQGEK